MSANLAEIIRARRTVRGMQRQDLAAVVGCDVRTVRRWENGSRPLARHIPVLREALDIPIQEMDRIILETIRDQNGGLRIEGGEYLRERGLSHRWLAETLLAQDKRLIGTSSTIGVQDPDQWASIFEALPDSWRLLTCRDEIIGNWHYLPTIPGVVEELRTGRLLDGDLRLEHATSLDLPGTLEIYFTALTLEGEFRRTTAIMMMLRSIVASLIQLAERGIYFSRITALACTPQAILLCQRLGMKDTVNTSIVAPRFFEGPLTALSNSLNFPEFEQLRNHYSSPAGPM